jgi:hypothetical protein
LIERVGVRILLAVLQPGTTLGRYQIRSQLGAGGMGEVYLAQDTRLDRQVALKILPDAVAADPDRMKRFVQEAKAASGLNHPNIITIYEIDETDSTPFIAAEFIEGSTLRERMRAQPLSVGEVLNVAVQVAGALAAAHANGIVHRRHQAGEHHPPPREWRRFPVAQNRRDDFVETGSFGTDQSRAATRRAACGNSPGALSASV